MSVITLRHFVDSDIPCLDNNWASSYYAASRVTRVVSPKAFHSFHRPIRDAFFKRQSAQILVCVDNEDANHILGWIGFERKEEFTLLEYIYIKAAYRGEFGIFKKMINVAIGDKNCIYTHFTPKFFEITKNQKDYAHWRYQPHMA